MHMEFKVSKIAWQK